jgi:HEAT repeat protein
MMEDDGEVGARPLRRRAPLRTGGATMATETAPAARASGPEDPYRQIRTLLSSADAADLREGLVLAEREIARVGSHEARPLFEIVASIFYLDPLDRPDLVAVLDEAVSLVVGFGEWVIPVLVDHLEAGDVKAQLAIGHALGRIGADAVEPLIEKYAAVADPAVRPFVLYALGKIGSPRVVKAIPLVLEAAASPELELRDTATRAIGRMAESIPPADLPEEWRRLLLERLQANLADPNAGIRAKAVRSLGAMASGGHLLPPDRVILEAVCLRLLGEDGAFDWDRAYIVRKEAEEALGRVRGTRR